MRTPSRYNLAHYVALGDLPLAIDAAIFVGSRLLVDPVVPTNPTLAVIFLKLN